MTALDGPTVIISVLNVTVLVNCITIVGHILDLVEGAPEGLLVSIEQKEY